MASLAELAWCDPEWCGRPGAYGSVDAVDSWLTPTPGLRSRWLTRMLPGLWDGRVDASAAPVLRCIPLIQQRIRQGTAHAGLLRGTADLADHLWPHIRERVGHDLPATEVCSLLAGTSAWRGGDAVLPQVVSTLERLSRRIDATASPEFDVLEAASAACTFLRKWGLSDAAALSALRRLARTGDLELGLAAIRTLMGLGESSDDEVVPLLLKVLARRDRPGRVAGRRGRRFDTNACAWLGELGPRALSASAVLGRLRDTVTEAGELRVAAASALWEITGDAAGALPVLHGYATAEGPAAAGARDALRRIERTSPRASGTKA